MVVMIVTIARKEKGKDGALKEMEPESSTGKTLIKRKGTEKLSSVLAELDLHEMRWLLLLLLRNTLRRFVTIR